MFILMFLTSNSNISQHVLSRKHRRFAEKVENWKELDALLSQLSRPLREAQEDDY
jgi:regulatory subunit for Cdc7p protein kinase